MKAHDLELEAGASASLSGPGSSAARPSLWRRVVEVVTDPGSVEYASWLQVLRHLGTRETHLHTRSSTMSTHANSLYDRLGRRDGIARITRTLIENHMANPLVNARYAASDMEKVERRVIEFFCAGAGGPETYTGEDMVAVHRGMNISEQEFVAVIDDAMAALHAHDIDQATCDQVLGILWSLKGQVVRV